MSETITKASALQSFFEGFDLSAYPYTAVPDDVVLPYLTYNIPMGEYGDRVSGIVNLWYKTTSEKIPNDKVQEIADAITLGGVQIPYDTGSIWIMKGSPFSNASTDPTDKTIKLRQINITLEYI